MIRARRGASLAGGFGRRLRDAGEAPLGDGAMSAAPVTQPPSPLRTPFTASPTRVLVVDDHPAIRDALAAVIGSCHDLIVCAEARTAEEAFKAVEREHPDVAVVDVSLPDAHGLDLVPNLLARHRELRVVMYSVYDELVYAERAIRAGALGYVMKREPTRVVLEAIRYAARDEVYLSRGMASRIVTKAALRRSTRPSSLTDLLTDREVAVIQLLGEGRSVEDIAERLHLSRKTVETHRRHAKEKLNLDTVPELLMYAIRWTDAQARSESEP